MPQNKKITVPPGDVLVASSTRWKSIFSRLDWLESLFNNLVWPLFIQGNRLAVAPNPFPMWVLITGATQDGSNLRWVYNFSQATKATAGYGGWSALSGGLTGTCYNGSEEINGATGLFGNGTTSANFLGTFTIQEIPNNTPVQIVAVPVASTGATEYWIPADPISTDGYCSLS